MTEFKVGDRVRVIDNKLIECCVNIGEIGVVLQENHPNYLVDFPERGNRWWLESDRIELVSPVPYFEFTFDEDVYTFSRKESVTFVKRGYHKRYTYYGFAVCNPPDKFDKLTGMQKALDRVLANWSEEGKAKAQKALLKAWKESIIRDGQNKTKAKHPLIAAKGILKGFVADNHLFLESEGWKDPKKEMPIAGAVNATATIEFTYSNDKHIYKGYLYGKYFIVWETGLHQTEEQDKLRTPDVIAWRYINRAEPVKNIDPAEAFKKTVDDFNEAVNKFLESTKKSM